MLRLRFEEKLNTLHALNRTFQQLSLRNGALLQQKSVELDELYEKYDVEKDHAIRYKADADSLAQWREHAEGELKMLESALEATKVEAQESVKRSRQLEMTTTTQTREIRDHG